MHVLILGASVRAAAFSARRAGLAPIAADLFGDRDLRAIAPAHRLAADSYPEGLAGVAATAPEAPWIYTGAIENHPGLVERIARHRPLWGNDGPPLRAVRDPFAVADVLRSAGLCCPEVRSDARGLPRDGSWLVKPLASAGGFGIEPLRADAGSFVGWAPPTIPALTSVGGAHPTKNLAPPVGTGTGESPRYFQERIDGPSLSAVFVASRGEGAATLAGVTRQWIGRRGGPFAYAGSLGPWPTMPRVRARIEAIGRALAASFRLAGLFGVDLILRDGEPWPVEVNPRYTASVEVLELALGRSLLIEHVRACDPEAAAGWAAPAPSTHSRPPLVGKRIVFAPTRCRFPEIDDRPMPDTDPFALPSLGDLPDPATLFEAGEPVLTLFAGGPTIAACRLRLELRRVFWVQRLRRLSEEW